MSVYVIYYDGGAKKMRPVLSEAQYRALRDDAKNRELVALVRGGEMELKRKLLQMNYSCVPDPLPPTRGTLPHNGEAQQPQQSQGLVMDGYLKGCKTPSNSVGMDIDFDVEDPDYDQKMASVPELILSKKDELGLLMLERSATKGYHVVFKRHEEMTQEQNLQWASQLLRVKYDEGAKDITRVFFTTTASTEDLLYLDPEIFRPSPAFGHLLRTPSIPRTAGAEIHKGEEGSPSCVKNAADPVNITTLPIKGEVSRSDGEGHFYQGHSFASIIAKYFELYNEGKLPAQGDRNVKTYELAMTLRAICEYDQQKLEAVIPRYDDFPEEEWRKTIANAVNEPRKGMPYRMRQILQALKSDKRILATGGTKSTPPPLPKKLPPLIKLLTSNVPSYYKPAVASAVFPALATHMHGVKFRYWDNVDHEPTLMNVLIARQSAGKRSIQQPIDHILASIKERDKPSRMREAEWKRQNPSGKTKAKDPRPEDICIQCLIDNLTDAVFNQRVVDADRNGHRFIYTQVDEIEALKKVTSKGTVDEVSLLIRKAFDNSDHGQERVGADSVSGIAPLRWNFNASTTPPNARKFFTKAVNDGTVGRLDIATIMVDKSAPNYQPPVQGIYDEKFQEELTPYLQRLESAYGLIECPPAKKLSIEMRGENDKTVDLIESNAYELLSYRANVIAWLKGMLLYVAHGFRWSNEIADFVRWSQNYNLWCKMLFFGEQLEQELIEEDKILQHAGPQNMLENLPDEFTEEQYMQMRATIGKTGDGKETLRKWKTRGYIVWDEIVNAYCKTEKYLAKVKTV